MVSIAECHSGEYGCLPASAASVPGRFHLLGEHLWFAECPVLSMSIDPCLFISISPRQDAGYRIYFATTGERKKISPAGLGYRREDRWVNSLKAVISAFIDAGEDVPGLNIAIQSEIPVDAGLGVPNAMKVGLALALRAFLYEGKKRKISDKALISLLEQANSGYLNIHPHTADLFCAFHAKRDTCIKTDIKSGTFELAAFPSSGYSVVLVDTKVPRFLAREEFNERLQECVDAYELVRGMKDTPADFSSIEESFLAEMPGIAESVRRRAVFIQNELRRVDDAARFLKANDLASFSRTIIHSHEGLRDRFEISCPELDWIVKRALEFSTPEKPDLVCARMTGKGFGGCAYAILPSDCVDAFVSRLDSYERIFGFTPLVYKVRPSGAAALL